MLSLGYNKKIMDPKNVARDELLRVIRFKLVAVSPYPAG